jgi:hypothetical protein
MESVSCMGYTAIINNQVLSSIATEETTGGGGMRDSLFLAFQNSTIDGNLENDHSMLLEDDPFYKPPVLRAGSQRTK